MLVELYLREHSGLATTIDELKLAAHCPSSTAQRWLEYLVTEGFVRRKPHPTETKIHFFELTPQASDAFDGYFAAVRLISMRHNAVE